MTNSVKNCLICSAKYWPPGVQYRLQTQKALLITTPQIGSFKVGRKINRDQDKCVSPGDGVYNKGPCVTVSSNSVYVWANDERLS